MSDKTIKRIVVPAITILGGALALGIADGIIYLLRNVIYGILMLLVAVVLTFFLWGSDGGDNDTPNLA